MIWDLFGYNFLMALCGREADFSNGTLNTMSGYTGGFVFFVVCFFAGDVSRI